MSYSWETRLETCTNVYQNNPQKDSENESESFCLCSFLILVLVLLVIGWKYIQNSSLILEVESMCSAEITQ